jgi:hypothetical protein
MLTRAGTIALRALVELARSPQSVLSGPELARGRSYQKPVWSKSCCSYAKPSSLKPKEAARVDIASSALLSN